MGFLIKLIVKKKKIMRQWFNFPIAKLNSTIYSSIIYILITSGYPYVVLLNGIIRVKYSE